MYPLLFFQFEIHGGIFQASRSSAVTLRGGECITGTGGEGGPRGTFLFLNLGGSNGSLGSCKKSTEYQLLVTKTFDHIMM
jgi:hypothetical protein